MSARYAAWRGLLAIFAFTYYGVMVVSGDLPTYGHFNAAVTAGLLRESPAAVTTIVIQSTNTPVVLKRVRGSWQTDDRRELPAEFASSLRQAIEFMHTAPPVRVLDSNDTPVSLRALGLAPPHYSITLSNELGILLRLDMGGANPDGILRYLRVPGDHQLYLMSGFVGAAWDKVIRELTGRAALLPRQTGAK